MQSCGNFAFRAAALFTFILTLGLSPSAHGQTGATVSSEPVGGPIRLRQPQQLPQLPVTTPPPLSVQDETPRYRPGEFEVYVQTVSGDASIRRFGSDFVIDAASARSMAQDISPQVPPDYR